MPPKCWSLLLAVVLSAPLGVRGQDLLSPADLLAQPWPEADFRIQYGTDPLQFGYLRLPEGDGPHPVIAFMHGGCFLSMFDIQHTGAAEQALADEGFAVWSIEYRRVGDEGGGWPNTYRDVGMAIDHLRELSAQHDLDLDRVFAAGQSAGGNFALWAAARNQVPASSDVYVVDPLPIRGVLALVPAPTMAAFHESGVCGGVVDRLMGGSPQDVPERYDATSPMRLMPDGVPQRIIVGAHDRAWRPAGEAYYAAALEDGGSEVSMLVAPESGHFEVIAPMSSTWALVIDELRKLTGALTPSR